ncbi:MAG: helix-turn-helix domain containing protein [Candidatus Poribacteria bacterium]|nr:helix-turn-helix domain containing protein [Candidatus Poribacteria bacterium]
MGIKADTEVTRAAALVLGNFSYADAEATLGLEEGTIMAWALDNRSPFNSLLGQMKFLANRPLPSEDIDDDPEELSDAQLLAIPLIIQGKTDAEVGEAIGRTRETVNRWRNHDDYFAIALDDARDSFIESQRVAVSASAQKAVSALEELLDCEDEKVRLQAASLLLKTAPALKNIESGTIV